jgi:DNA-binding MarR family transcriptional regulator
MHKKKTEEVLRNSLKALLRDTLDWIEAEQRKLLKDSSFASANNAEIKLFAALRGQSRSISELSRYLGVSRQAVHHTVHKLIEKRVVELQHPESNKRDKLVVISAKGREVQALTAKHFKTIESKMAINIGRDKVELLREQLLKNRAKIDKQTQA